MMYNKVRYERLILATPKWLTVDQWNEMDALYIKARGLTKKTGVEHQVDHIYPLAGRDSCGLHVPWNLQILTGLANRRKHTKPP
jgi:5-methylcytosine-specific restriction endonuclease McrA